MKQCFECEKSEDQIEIHDHHIVPKSKGGTKTISLCCVCHGLVHGKRDMNIGELTKGAMQTLIKKNKTTGKVPYGFRADFEGKLYKNREEILTLIQIEDCRNQGLSFRKIVSFLNDQGTLNRQGRDWNDKLLRVIWKGWNKNGRDRYERLNAAIQNFPE
jgi:hypothetical protein